MNILQLKSLTLQTFQPSPVGIPSEQRFNLSTPFYVRRNAEFSSTGIKIN